MLGVKSHYRDPRSYLLPGARYARVVHAVERVAQVLRHDDGSLDTQLEVHERAADRPDDFLHAVDLLTQEDVHGL